MAGTVVGPSPLRGGPDRDRRAHAAARPRCPSARKSLCGSETPSRKLVL
jgi:hypothetical protein